MYIKMIGSLFLMVSSATIGFLKADELKIRVKRLQELKRLISLMQGELRFHRAELAEAFLNVSEKVEEPFRIFLETLAEALSGYQRESFEELWERETKKLILIEGFLQKDLQLLDILGNGLGYLDLAMQTETLNHAQIRTEEEIVEAKKQQESRGKLYQTMGITAGALLTLLIV